MSGEMPSSTFVDLFLSERLAVVKRVGVIPGRRAIGRLVKSRTPPTDGRIGALRRRYLDRMYWIPC